MKSRTWQQPNAEQLEDRLRHHLTRLNTWRIHTGTHYPATLRVTAVVIAAALVVASVPAVMLTGAPLGIALILGPVFAVTVAVILVVPLLIVFDPGSDYCTCDECEGKLR